MAYKLNVSKEVLTEAREYKLDLEILVRKTGLI
jgi:hypothetical protein